MKRFTLILAAAAMCSVASAEVLSPEAALNRVASSQSARRAKGMSVATAKLVKTIEADNQPAVYLFSRGASGALILSADDATDAVLGVCDGTIDAANMPPAMTALLESYADQIAYARENPERVKAQAASTTERAYIAPKCTTLWTQAAPYNNECPVVTDGTSHATAATGCVATCLAQVLKYFNYPEQGEGVYSYVYNGNTYEYDFDNNPFYWDEMLDEYDSNSSDEAQDAVAQLMYACGVIVDMQYKYGGSGAYPVKLLDTGVKYLKLDKGLRYYNRDYYSLSEWNDMIYEALSTTGPVMYNGCILGPYTYAHEFVVDGYLCDELFHINWGWGYDTTYGNNQCYNGFFRLNALDYGTSGYDTNAYGYNYNQDAVCYIQPPVDGSKMFEQMYCTNGFAIGSSAAKPGASISITGGLYNYSAGTVSGVAGIKISDSEGNLVCYAGDTKFSNLAPQTGVSTYNVTLPSTLADGEYVIRPAFKFDDSDWRDADTKVAGVRSYSMSVSSDKCTFTANSAATITVSDFTLNTPVYLNGKFSVSAKITNSGSEPYSGKVAVGLISSNAAGTREQVYATTYYVPLSVEAGETLDYTLYGFFSSGTAGVTYKVALVDAANTILSDKVSVTMDQNATAYSMTAENPVVENQYDVDKNAVQGTLKVGCKSGKFCNYFLIYVFPYDNETGKTTSSNATEAFYTPYVTLNEGETLEVPFHGQLPTTNKDEYYVLFVSSSVSSDPYFRNAESTVEGKEPPYAKTVIRIGESAGVNDITNESKVLSTEYFNLQGVRLGEHVSEPGMYVKVEKLSDGTHRTSKCILRQ
jgi:hypothetical protein